MIVAEVSVTRVGICMSGWKPLLEKHVSVAVSACQKACLQQKRFSMTFKRIAASVIKGGVSILSKNVTKIA